MKVEAFAGFIGMLLVLQAWGQEVHIRGPKDNRFVYGGTLYVQQLPMESSEDYPVWNPGTGACPEHPTNATAQAVGVLGSTVPGIVVNPEPADLMLRSVGDQWYYEVQLALASTNAAPGVWSRRVNVLVGVDGIVPKFDAAKQASRRFGGGFRRANPLPEREDVPERELTPEEQAQKREEVRGNLRQYQMELLRAGMAPLPIPLTKDMEDELVKDGTLSPIKKDPKKMNTPPLNESWTNSIPDARSPSGISED